MWKRALLAALVLATVGLVIASPESNAESPPTGETREPRAVRVASVTVADASRESRFSGVTRAAERAQLGFTVSGRLVERPVELGDRVAEGDLLARVDRAPLRHRAEAAQAAVDRIEAQLAHSRKTQRRVSTLADSATVSEASRDEASSAVAVLEASLASAKVELAEARRLVQEATLRAPFDAVVSEVRAEAEEFVVAGSPVIVLAGVAAIEVEVEVPESLLPELAAGRAVRVAIPGLGRRSVGGTISAVGHAAPTRGRLFPVVVQLDADPDVVAGMAAELVLDLDAGPPKGAGVGASASAMAVPIEAVINPGGMHPALVRVRDGVTEELEVEVVGVRDALAIVREVAVEPGAGGGESSERPRLSVDDEVVVRGHAAVSPGEPVEVAR